LSACMDEQYDAIVLGTGLKECILSGLLSVDGLKVLHMDRNEYYGGASASLNLNQMFQQFKGGAAPGGNLGAARDYNIDLIPKFIMANGIMVEMLVRTNVTKYLEFKSIEGSYVYNSGKIYKVPATESEALTSSLMGLLEKRRFKKFLEFVTACKTDEAKSYKDLHWKTVPAKDIFKYFGLDKETVDFTGHALALFLNDEYLNEPAPQMIERVQLYYTSLMRYEKSPYIYPLYGLGELPQAFARLAAIYGGTYMLNKPADRIVTEDGKFVGVESGGEIARAKFVIGDPSYFPDLVKKTGQVVRIICILNHPIKDTKEVDSVQIIIPQKQVKRQSDIYVTMISSSHNVAPKGFYIALVSTTVETANPVAECQPALNLLGAILEQFVSISDTYEPLNDGRENKIFISKTFDATSHFETTCHDVMDIYKRVTGKELDLTAERVKPDEDA